MRVLVGCRDWDVGGSVLGYGVLGFVLCEGRGDPLVRVDSTYVMSVSGCGGPAGKKEASVVFLMCLRNRLEYPLCPSA